MLIQRVPDQTPVELKLEFTGFRVPLEIAILLQLMEVLLLGEAKGQWEKGVRLGLLARQLQGQKWPRLIHQKVHLCIYIFTLISSTP